MLRYANSAERLGSGTDAQRWSPGVCGFDSRLGHWIDNDDGSVGNGRLPWLGHRRAAVVAGMLWVRVPPELLKRQTIVLVEQPGVLATLSRWRRGFKSRRGRFENGAVRKLAKRPPTTLRAVPDLGELRVRLPPAPLNEICVGWASASSSGCNPPAFGLCRFNSCPAHWKTTWPVCLSVQDASPSSW